MADLLIKFAETREGSAATTSAGNKKQLRIYTTNLVFLVLSGVAISAWVLYYTDLFPVVGGLLGLGGLFAWIGFLTNLLSEQRKKELQERFESKLLERNRTWVFLLLLNILFLFWAWGQGSVLLDSQRDDTDRSAGIRLIAEDGAGITGDVSEYALSSRHNRKVGLDTKRFGGSNYRIKISGLPAATVNVAPFERKRLIIPSYFLRQPVILIKPSISISGTSANAEASESGRPVYELVAWVNKVEKGRITYRGETVWIGTDRDVAVPNHIRDKWRLELLKVEISEAFLSRWLSPHAIDLEKPLAVGDEVKISILRSDGQPFATATVQVKPISSLQDFPQEVLLDVAQ
jgi:hypothetical protein